MAYDIFLGKIPRSFSRGDESASVSMGHDDSKKDDPGLLAATVLLIGAAGGAFLLLQRSRQRLAELSGGMGFDEEETQPQPLLVRRARLMPFGTSSDGDDPSYDDDEEFQRPMRTPAQSLLEARDRGEREERLESRRFEREHEPEEERAYPRLMLRGGHGESEGR